MLAPYDTTSSFACLQVGQSVLDGLLNAAMSGHIRTAATLGKDVYVRPTDASDTASSASLLVIGFSSSAAPPLPPTQLAPLESSLRTLSSALLRRAAPGSKPVALVAGLGSLVWPPSADSSIQSDARARRLSLSATVPVNGTVQTPYVLCSPAYSLTTARHAASNALDVMIGMASPLPPCNYPLFNTTASSNLSAPLPSVSFAAATWEEISSHAAAATTSSSAGADGTLDAVIIQWGVSPVPSTAGWSASDESVSATLNLSDAALTALPAAPYPLRKMADMAHSDISALHPYLRTRALSPNSANPPPEPCSGVLSGAIGVTMSGNASVPALTPSQPDHGLDTRVLTVTVTLRDGSVVSSWGSSSSIRGKPVMIFIPFTAATAVRPQCGVCACG